jgi:Mg/Co/Ni transporter MgtE
MATDMLVAALAGTPVPVALERLRGDPAVATGVAVTTVTDWPPSRISLRPRAKFGLGRSR